MNRRIFSEPSLSFLFHRVIPLTYAIGYSNLLPLSSCKVPTLSTTSLKPTIDHPLKAAKVCDDVPSPQPPLPR